MDIERITDLEKLVKENWNDLNKLEIERPDFIAGAIRTTLEAMVKLFWWKKYDREPIFVKNGKETFELYDAIKSEKFYKFFNPIVISDMHLIRTTCNDMIHASKTKLTVKDVAEILKRLENCIKAIQETINVNIIFDDAKKIELIVPSQKSKPVIRSTNHIATAEDEKAKEVFENAGLIEEKSLYIKGIREFLCDYFEQTPDSVKGQMSSRWVVPWYQKVIVWVVEMEKIKPNLQTDKWVNVYGGNEIIEIMPKGKTTFGHVHVRDYAKQHPYRIVVEKMKNKLVVHGIYKFDEVKSVNDIEHYYVKI